MDNKYRYYNGLIYFTSEESRDKIERYYNLYPDLILLVGKELDENKLTKNSVHILLILFGKEIIKDIKEYYNSKGLKLKYPSIHSIEWHNEKIEKQFKKFQQNIRINEMSSNYL